MKTPAQRGAETRKINRLRWKRFLEVDLPAIQMTERLINRLLPEDGVRVVRNPSPHGGGIPLRLKKGVIEGTLIRFLDGGRTWRVLPDGYVQPQDYHALYWQPIEEARSV